MVSLMISVARLIMGFILVAAPLMCLIILLHVRDHRKAIIEGIVGKELNFPGLRGLVAANTKYALLSKNHRVEVDMWNCSNEQIRDVIDRLKINLPSNARLFVNRMPVRESLTGRQELSWNAKDLMHDRKKSRKEIIRQVDKAV